MSMKARIESLLARFNEPVIARERLEKWLAPFDERDRETALILLEHVDLHTYPRLLRECRELHEKLAGRLAASGLDAREFHDVDFSREFVCKSGDILSYIYRKANAIPAVDFKSIEQLVLESERDGDGHGDRALVLLDDYIGTGSQFLLTFTARKEEDIRLLNGYRRVFLASVVMHESALEKFALLVAGRAAEAFAIEERQFPGVDFGPDRERLVRGLEAMDWGRFEPVHLVTEKPLLAETDPRLTAAQKKRLVDFIDRHRLGGFIGTSFLMGHNAFFYGAPNSLPEVLLPLFTRVEDLSICVGEERYTVPVANVVTFDVEREGRS